MANTHIISLSVCLCLSHLISRTHISLSLSLSRSHLFALSLSLSRIYNNAILTHTLCSLTHTYNLCALSSIHYTISLSHKTKQNKTKQTKQCSSLSHTLCSLTHSHNLTTKGSSQWCQGKKGAHAVMALVEMLHRIEKHEWPLDEHDSFPGLRLTITPGTIFKGNARSHFHTFYESKL